MSMNGLPRDLIDTFSRAERDPNRRGPARKHAYSRLIELAHSTDTAQKLYATEKINEFFNDFPDVKDDAMNAIYDLCEDADARVRKSGYRAITSVSRVDKDWLVRNVDVLVQLLQSDERDEVAVVERALQDHIDIDPINTLQVLCYQCVLDTNGLDAEELGLRRRLRKLVIRFFVHTAKDKILSAVRGVGKANDIEQAFFKGLLLAIPNSDPEEVHDIYSGIILNLPLIHSPGPNTKSLLTTLLAGASQAVKDELNADNSIAVALRRTIAYLQPAHNLTINRRAAEPSDLLRFYLTSSLLSPGNIERVDEESKTNIACFVGDAWAAMQVEMLKKGGSSPMMVASRNQLVEASPPLLEILSKTGLTDVRSSTASVSLLKACQSRRQSSTTWAIPAHLSSAIKEIQRVAQAQSASTEDASHTDQIRNVQIICRSLLAPQEQNANITGTAATGSNTNGSVTFKNGTLGERSAGSSSTPQGNARPAIQRSRTTLPQAKASMPISILGAHRLEDDSNNNGTQVKKRVKIGPQDPGSGSMPSLLSRLQANSGDIGASAMQNINDARLKNKRRNTEPKTVLQSNPAPRDIFDDGGSLRIKGAARLESDGDSVAIAAPISLLDRIKDADGGGGKKRKR